MTFKIEESKNAYESNSVYEHITDGEINVNGINLLKTGAVSPLNMILRAPKNGGRCVIKLSDDGGQNAVITLLGCTIDGTGTTITLLDVNDEISLYFKKEVEWIDADIKGSIVIS